ncbi:MAG TPA: DUF4126 domain-containing protein [Thermomicrobiales bacterium]|nr:DUF4126 domain-containing protein [Thermomicrobiales bacterium]
MYEILTGLGLAMPAGLNAYIPLLAVALADRYTGLIHLTAPYDVISSPVAIVLLIVLLLVELLADKIPVIDHVNDLVQSAIRPSSGAVLMMASTDALPAMNPIVAMILGLTIAGAVHVAKAAVRPVVTAMTGGIGNPVVSAAEDGAAIGITVIALVAPILIVVVIVAATYAVYAVYRRRARRRHAPDS